MLSNLLQGHSIKKNKLLTVLKGDYSVISVNKKHELVL